MKIVGPYTSPTIYSENPGIVELVSSDPSVASVDASVTIEGTRVYGNMGQGGDYVARAGAEGNARMDRTWLLRVDWNAVQCGNNATAGAYIAYPILASMRMDSTNRLNWFLFASVYNANGSAPNRSIRLALSQNSGTNPVVAVGTLVAGDLALAGVRRYAVTITGTTVAIYTDARATVANNTVSGISGTMGGSEALVWQSGVSCSKIARVCSNAELDAWFADGTIPASDREFVFSGGHEIDPSLPVIWDTSGNATPLDLTATQITNWQAPGMSADFTDDPLNPVVPFQPFTITPNSVGTFTITARRRRQGVPDRATDEEKYETTSETFTITEMPQEVVQYVRLLITTSTPGTVDIASSDPSVVTFPSSVVVGPTLQYEVLGTVVGAGTSIITTSMGGAVLDTTTVTIEDTPTVIEAGPPQNLRTRI